MAKRPYSDLPKFKYHPRPFSSGAILESDDVCECCGQSQGYIYDGPVYCIDEVDRVCPWCIADGSAHSKWDAEFIDAYFRDSYGDAPELAQDIVAEVLQQTPGVVGALQSVMWWVHCGEPAEFLRIEDDLVCFRCCNCGENYSYQDLD